MAAPWQRCRGTSAGSGQRTNHHAVAPAAELAPAFPACRAARVGRPCVVRAVAEPAVGVRLVALTLAPRLAVRRPDARFRAPELCLPVGARPGRARPRTTAWP